MTIDITPATPTDKSLLLKMNHHLMEDEEYDRPPDADTLGHRWDEFLGQDRFGVYLFRSPGTDPKTSTGRIVGYAVVHLDDDPRYLRHFFIRREERRYGFGTVAFRALLEYLGVKRMDLDVMSWNNRGLAFWESLGFRERCRVMAYEEVEKHTIAERLY